MTYPQPLTRLSWSFHCRLLSSHRGRLFPRPSQTTPTCCRTLTSTLTSTPILGTVCALKTCALGLELWRRLWRHFRPHRLLLPLPLPLRSGLQRPASATTALLTTWRRHRPCSTASLSLEPSPEPSTASSTSPRISPTFLFRPPSPARRIRPSLRHRPPCLQHPRRGDDRGDRSPRPQLTMTRPRLRLQ